MLVCVFYFVPIAHETAGAARIRLSLRPLIGEGVKLMANLGRMAPRELYACLQAVIASEAKQSIFLCAAKWIASSQELLAMTLKEGCPVMAGLDPAIHLLKIDGCAGRARA